MSKQILASVIHRLKASAVGDVEESFQVVGLSKRMEAKRKAMAKGYYAKPVPLGDKYPKAKKILAIAISRIIDTEVSDDMFFLDKTTEDSVFVNLTSPIRNTEIRLVCDAKNPNPVGVEITDGNEVLEEQFYPGNSKTSLRNLIANFKQM